MTIQALLFDKDGTLFDFSETWNNWTLGIIAHYAGGVQEQAQRIADAIEFDLDQRAFLPSSPIIAGTNREAAELWPRRSPILTLTPLNPIYPIAQPTRPWRLWCRWRHF